MKCYHCGTQFYTSFCPGCGVSAEQAEVAPPSALQLVELEQPLSDKSNEKSQAATPSFSTRKKKLAIKAPNLSWEDVDSMDGGDFEWFVADLLYTNGFDNVDVTPQSGDYGADVVAYQNGEKCVIQCKRYSGNCGQSPVREIFAAKTHYSAQRAIVVTNAFFSKAAQTLAASTDVELWDRDVLHHMMDGKQVLRHPVKNKNGKPWWYIFAIIFLPFYFVISLLLKVAKKYK